MVKGDREAALECGVSRRSIYRWRAVVAKSPDGELAQSVRAKKERVEQAWADELNEAILAATRFLHRSAEEGNPKDPSMVHSIAGALKMLSEVSIGQKLLDARLSRKVRSARKKAR